MRPELANPKIEAQVLRHDLGILGRPDLPAVLQSLGVVLKEVDMDDGFDGAALRTPKRNGILINKSVRYWSRRRFTIAHELGHLRLPGHDGEEYRCQSADIESFNPDRLHEREADEFAAEFLLPEAIIQPVFRKQQFSFNLIEAVAKEYETSLTATALRGITYTPDCFAVVLSMDRRIRWARRSESFRYSVQVGSLHHDTYAADFFVNCDLPTGPVQVNPHAWLSDRGIPRDLMLSENSISFPRLGAVLTLLSYEPQEDDELEMDAF